jgi:hypothetical protein
MLCHLSEVTHWMLSLLGRGCANKLRDGKSNLTQPVIMSFEGRFTDEIYTSNTTLHVRTLARLRNTSIILRSDGMMGIEIKSPPRPPRGRRPPPPNSSETESQMRLDWNKFIARWTCYSEANVPLYWLNGDVWKLWSELPSELQVSVGSELTRMS